MFLQDGLGRKVAILGDMGELGTDEAALHEGVGVHAGQCRIDACICVGPLAAHIAEKASQTNPGPDSHPGKRSGKPS